MNEWWHHPYLWLGVVLLLVLGIAVLSVVLIRCRETRLRSRLPVEKLQALFAQGFAPAEILLGVPQSTLWKAGLELLDCEGRTQGKVHYGWRNRIWIEMGGRTYRIQETRAPFLEATLALDGEPLCTCVSGRLVTDASRFAVPGAGTLTVEAGLKSIFQPELAITAGGATVGRVVVTGYVVQGHAVLALKGNYSAPVRAYILALEFRRK